MGKAPESACAVAAAVCMAVGSAPSASTDDTTADAALLPDHIVNGDFEYQHDWFREHAAYGWTAVVPSTGLNWNDRMKGYQPGPDDWNEARFGWHSTQADGTGAAYRNKGEATNLASSQDDVAVLYAQWEDAMTAMPETGGTGATTDSEKPSGEGLVFWPSSRPCWRDGACAETGSINRKGGVTCRSVSPAACSSPPS